MAEISLPRKIFEEMLEAPSPLDKIMDAEVILDVFSTYGAKPVKTCYGDICKTVNALMDYSRLLETVCDQWSLAGYHRASYELRAQQLRKIAEKLQKGIGYNYEAALRRCGKRRRRRYDDGVGEDALVLTVRGKDNNPKEAAKCQKNGK